MWKKRRGKLKYKRGAGEEIPKNDDELDRRIKTIETRLTEVREEKKRLEQRKDKKKKLEEHWQMMRWLIKYIEENKYTWERRRQIQEEEQELVQALDDWMAMNKETQIQKMITDREAEYEREKKTSMRREKARNRKRMWKEWRTREGEEEETEELEQYSTTHQGEAERE